MAEASPEYTRHTLVGRSFETFRSYLKGDYKDYFLNKEYIESLAEQRNQQVKRMAKFGVFTYVGLLLMVYLPELGPIKTPILEIEPAKITMAEDLLQVLVSAFYFSFVTKFIDYFVVNICLSMIFFEMNIFSGQFFYLNISPDNIWIDTIQKRYFGPESTWQHSLIALTVNAIIIVLAAAFFIVPAAVVFGFAVGGLSEDTFSPSWLLDAVSILIVGGTLLIAVVVLFVPVKFRKGWLLEGRRTENTVDPKEVARVLGLAEQAPPSNGDDESPSDNG